MKKIYLVLIILITSFSSLVAQTTNETITFGGLSREYVLHIPTNYTPGEEIPLVFCMHGLGDNIANFSNAGFHSIADTENFIVVTPQAVDFTFAGTIPVGTSWNSGVGAEVPLLGQTIFPNENIDDVAFVSALIDSLEASFSIDTNRIYATGFSMGGFMCNRLAVELNDRIAAIASVSGTLGINVDRSLGTPIPVMHVHGTADATIDYNADYSASGGLYFIVGDSVNGLMNYWTGINQTDNTPSHDTSYAIVNGLTVEHFKWDNGTDSTTVELFKVNGGEHVWNAPFYPNEIWNFFKQHKNRKAEITEPTPTSIRNTFTQEINIYPNPTNDFITIVSNEEIQKITLLDNLGVVVLTTSETTFSVEHLSNGIYHAWIEGETSVSRHTIVKK